MEITKELIEQLRISMPEKLAKEICSVQPINFTPEQQIALTEWMKSGKTEAELRAEGYVPVCETTKLMWIKKNDN